MVFDHCGGGDLEKYLKMNGAQPESTVRRIAKQLAQALNYLHEDLNVIHRDIKPANIFISAIQDASPMLVETKLTKLPFDNNDDKII